MCYLKFDCRAGSEAYARAVWVEIWANVSGSINITYTTHPSYLPQLQSCIW